MSINSPGPSSPESATRIPVDVRRLPGIRRFAADYAYDFPSVAPFFTGNPSARADWAAAIQRAQAQPRNRPAVAGILQAQQARRGAPAAAREAARQLADSRSVAVVTGQQAGLFGGPLFTLLKALTAIKLARRVADEHGVPAVAIFWVEAEDHDWDEVRSCTVLDAQLEACTVALPARTSASPDPVAAVRLDESVEAALDELSRTLSPTEFTAPLLDRLRQTYAPGAGMADAFAAWLEQLLGDRGLIVYDASDRAAKALVADVFARELADPGHTGQLAAAAGADLEARGYHAQVRPADGSLALFRMDGGRYPIRHQNGRLVVGDTSYTAADLQQEASRQPAAFSPSVLLRPVVQDTLFPTIGYVAGPNELAYLGQLRAVYDHFGVPMPLMYPRASATLLDSSSLRFLTKYGLPIEALQAQDESALNALLQAQIPPAVEQCYARAQEVIDACMADLVRVIPALDPTLEGAAQSTLGRMRHDLGTLHNKMIQAAKRRDETLRRQFMRARALAFPHGHAQERTIGFVSFLNTYGPALIDRLEEELPLDLGVHWIVTV